MNNIERITFAIMNVVDLGPLGEIAEKMPAFCKARARKSANLRSLERILVESFYFRFGDADGT